jgi:hypothetical protein
VNDQPQQQFQPAQRDPNQPRQNVPVPDPSLLTTAALDREVAHLQQLLAGQIDDIAKDLARFQDNHDERHRDVVGAAISHLKELCEVKFSGVATRFEERDLRFAQRDADSNEAIKAALSAAKEAVAKSEATFTKEIDSLKELIATNARATDQQIRDIKDEQTGARGQSSGIDKTWALVMTLVPILISAVGVVIVIATR